MRFFPFRGIDKTHKTVGLDHVGNPHFFEGYLIPHGEANSLSSFLTYKKYRPTVFYVYSPSKCGEESLDKLRKNNYIEISECHVLDQNDIIKGFDSVGALLFFNGSGEVPKDTKWWAGTVVDLKDVKKNGFIHSGPTVVQVAAGMNAAIIQILKNKNNGLMLPEEFNWVKLLKECSKYLGNIYSREIKTSKDISTPSLFVK